MPSDTATAALRDIAHHIDLAAHFVSGFDGDAFKADLRTVDAVTRCLEIISEASRRLPDALKARHPSIAWKDMAGAGNIYRLRRRCRAAGVGCGSDRLAAFAHSD